MNTRKLTRTIVAAAAVILAAALTPAVASAQGDPSQATGNVIRLWGPDRYATSLAVAKAVAADAGGSLSAAVLVSGRSWTDAVTAAPLAGSLDAPVLLADPRSGVSEDTKAFMEDVGIDRLIAVGSADNLPAAALSALADIDSGIERVAAADKHATSVAVARKMGTPARFGSGYGQTVILASGAVFADALSAGPLAAGKGIPILLTDTDRLSSSVSDYIGANADHVIILGGTAAVSASVGNAVARIKRANEPSTDMAVSRVGGRDRFETATLFAEFIAENSAGDDCFDGTVAGLATGGVPADAFSSAPLLARLCAPLVLTYTHRLPDTTRRFLNGTERLYVFGGTAAVSDAAVAQWTPDTAVQTQFRRWDHQALIDLPLWSHCPPEDWGAISDRLDGYDITWANWDTAAFETGGHRIAVGYLTDEQIDRWLPGSGITAADALSNLFYNEAADSTLIWRGIVTLHLMDTPPRLPTLKAAMQSRGVYNDNLVESLKVTRHGIDGSGAWPSDLSVGLLLTDWVRWRYAWPPTTAEPVAWPLRSLFEARESTCAGEALIEMCASDETPPAMLARNHPIGRVLRSLACAE